MLDLTKPLREFLATKTVDATNTVWRLHSRATVLALVFFTILLSARAYFGDPIDCISGVASDYRKSMNSFCWILGTFISRDPDFVYASWDIITIGRLMGNIPEGERLYQKYYQWVPFFLAMQAILFSVPKHLWRFYENGRLLALCENLTSILTPSDWTVKRKANTLVYLTQQPRSKFNSYALLFLFLEFLNFLIVLLNMVLMNFIFGGFWNSYQPAMRALFALDMNSWTSYNSLVFPKLAKCDFQYVGPSGSKQTMDALCLLPQNIVNEKIFAFLWVWFILLAIISGTHFCYRLAQLCSPGIRFQLLYSRLQPVNYHRLQRVVREASIGTWFLLYQMARNVNSGVMKEIIRDLAKNGQQQRSVSKQTIEEQMYQQQQQGHLPPPMQADLDEDGEEDDFPEDDEVTV